MLKKTFPIILVAVLSILIVYAFPTNSPGQAFKNAESQFSTNSIVAQKVVDTNNTPQEITKIYDGNQLIGIINNQTQIDNYLSQEYTSKYENEYPDTKLGYSEDVYTVKEMSYFIYEKKDAEIFSYLRTNDKFAVEVTKVTFSNGTVIYVKNSEDFESAKKLFLLNFISDTSYDIFTTNGKTQELNTYGYRDTGLSVYETVEVTKGRASINNILNSENEVLYYLSYGVNPKITNRENETWYEVKPGDTVAGIAWLNNQITVDQLMANNSTMLFSKDQVLQPGMKLNVTKISSPFNVFVTRERLYQEIITPDAPKYVSDSSLAKGKEVVDVAEESGLKNVKRQEVYLNGILTNDTSVISEVVTKPAVQGIIRYGTYIPPSTGTGNYMIPVDNANMTCDKFCYTGHRGVDWQNKYQREGTPVYAGDTGIIEASGWDGGFGNRVIINHNNGVRTLYAHMKFLPVVKVGQTVQRGEIIGYVGATGNVTGPHVHVEVYTSGGIMNPCNGYFKC